MGFIWSKINECVYFCGSTIFFCYVDDSVLIDPNKENIDKVFAELQALKYNVMDEGQIDDYLGVKSNDGQTVPSRYLNLIWLTKF
jgi:hypothetical protein